MEMTNREDSLAASRDRVGTWGRPNAERMRNVREYAVGKVVDLGCGSDAYTSVLRTSGHETTSVDLLTVVPTPPRFVRATASELPFSDACFDTALLFEVLEHVERPERVLTEIARVANRLILSVPNCADDEMLAISGLVPYHYTDRTHVNFFDEASVSALLESNGWVVHEVRRIGRVSPGALALRGWGMPLSIVRRIAPILKRLPRPHPVTMSILVVADRRERIDESTSERNGARIGDRPCDGVPEHSEGGAEGE